MCSPFFFLFFAPLEKLCLFSHFCSSPRLFFYDDSKESQALLHSPASSLSLSRIFCVTAAGARRRRDLCLTGIWWWRRDPVCEMLLLLQAALNSFESRPPELEAF